MTFPAIFESDAPVSFYDPEAEKTLLAAILCGDMERLPDNVSAPETFSRAHGQIYRAARRLHNSKEPVDLLTVTRALEASGELEAAGGRAYLTSLVSTAYHGTLLTSAVDAVWDCFKRREFIRLCNDAKMDAEGGDSDGALQRMKAGLPLLLAATHNNTFATALLSEGELVALRIPPRKSLLGDWFKEGDYGVIYGRRGLGKSWLAMAMARALTEGEALGPWERQEPVRVLYVDGEMALDDYQARVHTLSQRDGGMLTLSHQSLFDKTGKALCLSDYRQQEAMTRLCEEQGVKVLFLDNGACLFRSVEENSADDFRDKIEGWILDLRRRGVAVVLVLHAGRNGNIRGTSKREDAAFWIIGLDEVSATEKEPGARFITRFTKARNPRQHPPPIDWHFRPDGGKTLITHKEADSLLIFRQWVENGLTSCGEIAEEMGLTKGTVSKMAMRGLKEGWLKKHGRGYALVQEN